MTIEERINMLRRSVLIHSCLYYMLDTQLISDKAYDKMARELDMLHKQYPDIAGTCVFNEAFKDFTPATGYDLPIDDNWVVSKAYQLIRGKQQMDMQNQIKVKTKTAEELLLDSLDLENMF